MRKITQLAINAFLNGQNFKLDNTEIKVYDSMYEDEPQRVGFYLHGNIIAVKELLSNEIKITNAGWSSNTTKERLNGIPGVRIHQKNHQWYLNGNPWNGDWAVINKGDNV